MPHERSGGSLTLERLKWLLDYDRETGIFIWRNRDNRPDFIGKRAGCFQRTQGYHLIRVDGFLYKASRLAWFYCIGEWPANLIDHIDGKRDNDAFANLREASSARNNANKRVGPSQSGFKGVYRNRRGRYVARLLVNRRSVYLGTFIDPSDAAVAYNIGAVRHFGQFARLNQL